MRSHHRLIAGLTAVVLAAGGGTGAALASAAHNSRQHQRSDQSHSQKKGKLPVKAINRALQLQGTMADGVLSYSFDQTKMKHVHIGRVPITPSFMINGSFDFQPLGHGRAFFNGDFPVAPKRIDAAISAIVSNGLIFQAEHQHMYDFKPIVFFIHLRAKGNAVKLAQRLHKVLQAAGMPLPQSSPQNPKTPLKTMRLKKILHGYSAQVGQGGVVTVFVSRRDPIYIDGVRVKPATNIATNVAFEPLNKQGTEAAVIPDYGMTASEINPLMRYTRSKGWDIGCLYNQETNEHPQLFFSHQFKVGNPYLLAAQVRQALNRTNTH